MRKLIEALELPENMQKMGVLSVSTAFAEMKEKHSYFETVFGEQANANAGLRQMASASSIRRSLEQTLKAYLNVLTAMKDATDWKDAYAEVNELVKAAKNSTVARKNKESDS